MNEDRHILITGGAGYIGSALTGSLLRRGNWVTVVDDLVFGGESLMAYLPHSQFHFVKGDVFEPGLISLAAREGEARAAPPVSTIVHLAAISGFPVCKTVGREITWRTNVKATERVFEQADELGVERLLYSSTYSVYGVVEDGDLVSEESPLSPQSLYAESKIAAEEYLINASQSARCTPLIYRFATLYGPSPRMRFDLIINQFVMEAFTRGELVIYQRGYTRSFIHIRDLIEGIVVGFDAPEELVRGQIYNLGNEDGNYSKDEIVALIKQKLPETRVQHKDLAFDGDMRDVGVSYRKIQQRLGFHTRWTVEDGIEEIIHILQTGLIKDPTSERYRNAEFIVQ
ncbi:MAG: epimerase [Anaerolineae bacterium SM23_ 63]|nr:MAG: epimerase [Anaerolineae bacterium SM23_ 63]HEY48172.1 NAD(P)-dependent oxidoreductase [Anaerolineae bacterium]